MRKWHRWLSVLFGVLILFIATTGLLSHFPRCTAMRNPRRSPQHRSASSAR